MNPFHNRKSENGNSLPKARAPVSDPTCVGGAG